ncbi:hypothetical protein [Shewanella metallivivens]|uniref:Uncharacterized protein n=1 Tax=Shewanella metallivivens TaxID=2872342 RepID=A0ABT5TRV1_9GAMM|nr:hypothetical protein [Shewanella metallivivens]MDD8061232.1 hypothetical protein [Shewanella metallivivens]
MENLRNGFLWGLGFGVAITVIILISEFLNPSEYTKMKDYTPTKIENFEIKSMVSRVEGSKLIIAGEYAVSGNPVFKKYEVDAIVRNEKGIFQQQCSTDIGTHSVEVEKSFTNVLVCRDFSDINAAALIEVSLIGFK